MKTISTKKLVILLIVTAAVVIGGWFLYKKSSDQTALVFNSGLTKTSPIITFTDNQTCTPDRERVLIAAGHDAPIDQYGYSTGPRQYSDVWQADASGNWIKKSPDAAFGKRAYGAMVYFLGKVWVMGGGLTGGGFAHDVWMSADAGTTWNKIDGDQSQSGVQDAPWSGRMGFGAVPFNNKVYLFGGQTASKTTSNEVWSFDGTTWTKLPDAPWTTGKAWFGTTVFNNKIYVVGGRSVTLNSNNQPVVSISNEVWSFDGTTWTKLANAPWDARDRFGIATYSGKLWIAGGYKSYNTWLNEVWSFDGTTWTKFDHNLSTPAVENAPWNARAEFSMHSLMGGKLLWMFSGSHTSGSGHNSVEYFDDDMWYFKDTWTQAPMTEGHPSARDGYLSTRFCLPQ